MSHADANILILKKFFFVFKSFEMKFSTFVLLGVFIFACGTSLAQGTLSNRALNMAAKVESLKPLFLEQNSEN